MDNKIILMVVVSFILGMVVANMFKDVCGCKNLIEGQGCPSTGRSGSTFCESNIDNRQTDRPSAQYCPDEVTDEFGVLGDGGQACNTICANQDVYDHPANLGGERGVAARAALWRRPDATCGSCCRWRETGAAGGGHVASGSPVTIGADGCITGGAGVQGAAGGG